MKIAYVCGAWVEQWDYRNPDEVGIGGSETHQIEMAQRLAQRGHEVVNFVPVRPDTEPYYKGIWYRDIAEFVWKKHFDLWVIARNPGFVHFLPDGARAWFFAHDAAYLDWSQEIEEKYERVCTQCASQTESFRNHLYNPDKVWQTQTGLRVELIEEIEATAKPERNPKRIMYASDPQRGLKNVVHCFKRVQEMVPDIEMHLYYGFDNLKKQNPQLYRELEPLSDWPGITWHGRTGQRELYKEWFKAGIWLYPTNFRETGCIAGMEAMAMGAVPICSPYWAVKDQVLHGYRIEGDADASDTLARFSRTLLFLVNSPEAQEAIRPEMMAYSRERFNWERAVDQWEAAF